jgi:hypothetical protein
MTGVCGANEPLGSNLQEVSRIAEFLLVRNRLG